MQRRYGLDLRQGMCCLSQVPTICRSTKFVRDMVLHELFLLIFVSPSISLDSAEPGKRACEVQQLIHCISKCSLQPGLTYH